MARYQGKFQKQTAPSRRGKPRSRVCRWIGIACAIPALICAFFVGEFIAGSLMARASRQEAIQTYVLPAEAEPEDVLPGLPESTPEAASDATALTTEATTLPTEPPRFPTIDFDGLWEKNGDVVAWLQIPALEIIDYPVVQGTDNACYTTHTWDKKESENGAIFLDFRNSGDFSQIHNVIYGHCMKDGSMFQSLGEWEKTSFQNSADRTLLLFLPQETRVYEIFAVERVNALDSRVFKLDYVAGSDWEAALKETIRLSHMDSRQELTDQAEVLTLSTCIGGSTRLVVHAVCVERVPT